MLLVRLWIQQWHSIFKNAAMLKGQRFRYLTEISTDSVLKKFAVTTRRIKL